MLKRLTICLFLIALTFTISHATNAQDEVQTPDTFAQSLRAGCYIAAANQCRIHVEPFTIPINSGAGERVAAFQIFANNVSGGPSYRLYDFSTDSTYSYKPQGNYTPSQPVEDFYGQCGQTYYLNILTRGDTSTTQGSFGNAGITAQFSCPVSPAVPTAIQQSFFGLDSNHNVVITWPVLLLLLPLGVYSMWQAYREKKE